MDYLERYHEWLNSAPLTAGDRERLAAAEHDADELKSAFGAEPVEHVLEAVDVLYLVDEKVLRPRDGEQGPDEGLELFRGLDGSVPVSV